MSGSGQLPAQREQDPRIRVYWPIGVSRDLGGRNIDSGLLETELAAYAAWILGPDAEVEIAWLEKSTGFLASSHLGMLNDSLMIRDILRAQARGFDAALVGPHWDPGLWAAREAATIPVCGPGESAMQTALSLGRRFAFLTMNDRYVPIIEGNIRRYGLESRAICHRPVRCFEMTFEALARCMTGEDDGFVRSIGKTALECVADGADVVIVGGQLFGPALRKQGFFRLPESGVPLLEVAACGLKMAQAMVGLRRTVGLAKSEHVHSPFRTPPPDVSRRALQLFGLVDDSESLEVKP